MRKKLLLLCAAVISIVWGQLAAATQSPLNPENSTLIVVTPANQEAENPLHTPVVQQSNSRKAKSEQTESAIYAILAVPKTRITIPPGSNVVINIELNAQQRSHLLGSQEQASPGSRFFTLENLMSLGGVLFSLLVQSRMAA